MNDFDKVITKIRSGELILWVGSGFSSLAGYPTGSQLANIIKEKLNPNEKQYFENKYNLDEVAEEFVLIRSREVLASLLSEVLKEVPKSLMYHKMVSEIPQIQTIITTNYDKSFEYAYGNGIFPITSDKDFPTIPRNKVSLYKIHGDIDVSDSMIITKSDYLDYYNGGKENLIWNEIKSLISKYSILFIGYSFEDSNIKSIFEYILKRLGSMHKDCYLVTRNLSDHKQRHLLEKYSIHYISMSAEEAISNIQKEVEKNLIIDAGNGYIPQYRINKLFLNRKINTRFIVEEDGKLILDTIGSLEGGPDIIFSMLLTPKIEKSNVINELKDIIDGTKFGTCTLYQDDFIINVSAQVGESLLFDPKYGNADSLTIKSNPICQISANLLLRKSGLYFNNLKGERYSSISAGEIRLFHDGFDLTIKTVDIQRPIINFNLRIHTGKSIRFGYEVYHFFNSWIEEDELQIYFDFYDKPYVISFSKLIISDNGTQIIKKNYDFYSKVFRIQREFDVSFDDITNVTDDDLSTLNKIIFLLDDGKLPLKNSISFQTKKLNKEQFLKSLDKEESIIKIGPIVYTFTFLGIDIKLGCDIHLYNGFIDNKKEVVSKLAESFEDIDVTVKSKSNECFLLLSKESNLQNSIC